MIFAVVIFIVILLLITTIAYISYLVWHYPGVTPPLQPQNAAGIGIDDDTAEIGIDNDRLRTWLTLTYAEATSHDPRAVVANCCSICLVDYEEQGEDNTLRLLPECGHLFHAACVDPSLRRRQTCPMCRSLVVNEAMQMPSAEMIPVEIE